MDNEMHISTQSKIKEIISENRLLEGVLFRFGIRNPGNCTLQEASIDNKKNPYFVAAILKAFDENHAFPKKELASFPLLSLLDYLRQTHEYYLFKKMPEIEQSLGHLLNSYPDSAPLFNSLARFFVVYKNELSRHIEEEEEYLFPYIEYLIKLKQHGTRVIKLKEKLKNYSLGCFIYNHDEVEKNLMEVRQIISKYSPALSQALPFRIFLSQLETFEKDLIRHARVEDEVLVPKALWLEKYLNSIQ
jgi:regulator of cell morphogenesis and NO signaling